MKKRLIPLFLVIFLILFSIVSNAYSVSYYNWIQNPSFEQNQNLVEDASFESGIFNAGLKYGNFSTTEGEISPAQHYTGVYSCYIQAYSTVGLVYQLADTYYTLGNDVLNFSFWVYPTTQTYSLGYRFNYTDDTSQEFSASMGTANTWHFLSLLSNINKVKYLKSFSIRSPDGCSMYLDCFYLLVYDPNLQNSIDFDTTPWYCGGSKDLNQIGLNTVFGHTGSCSVYMGYDEWFAGLYQEINYLDTNTVHYIDLWAFKVSTTGIAIKINLIYSDRSYTSKTVNVTATSSWQYLMFSGFILPNKYIIQIQIFLKNYYPDYVNIDDVGLWSVLPSERTRFSFTLNPLPITKTANSFAAYEGISYTLICTLYNVTTGQISGNGTYQISDIFGLHTGSISSGQFSQVLDVRSASTDLEEQIIITMVMTNEILTVNIRANWYYINPTQPPPEGYNYAPIISLIVPFMFLFITPMILVPYVGKAGFIVGLCIGAICLYIAGLLPLWTVFLIGLAIILLLLSGKMGAAENE